ncbi:taste receptor type 2 member 2-like [Lissotriton helveticus]
MPSVSVVVCLAVLSMEITIGAAANGFLIIVNIMDYFKTPSFCPSKIILGSLGLTRLGFQCIVMIYYVLQFLFPWTLLQDRFNKPISSIWMFFNSSSLWCASWLCVYYCIKIANFTNVAFSFLKIKFSKLLPFLLLGSLLVSLAFCLPFMVDINVIFGNGSSTFSQNNTAPAFTSNINYLSWTLVCTLGSSLPFTFFWIAAALLMSSLRRHAQRMKGSEMGGFRNPSIKAHCRAMAVMIIFFLFYASFVASYNVSASGILQNDSWQSCLCAVVIGAYPSLHSLVLILSNPKMREGALRALPWATRISSPGALQVSSITP